MQHNGHPYTREAVSTYIDPDGTTTSAVPRCWDRASQRSSAAGWDYNSEPRTVRGPRFAQRAELTYVPPESDVRYWIGSYNFAGYLPHLALGADGEHPAGYGKALGDTTALPPYKRFYAGGPDTVRGYTEDTLGPVDTNGNPYGGNMLTVSRTELIVPMPEKWQTSARASLFFDMGNVFSTDGTQYRRRGPGDPRQL